ncbi:MAG: shikimate dehydrogenase [Methylovulum sp.]|jgi:shikimate dehydrogenase|nr:shikimate dehydrogenase [Methylovulum sp.]MCF8000021.1 shikimate dehydrogenase [Methylovulum sp.]
MTPSIDRYAVFGQPIQHSKSPRIHQLFAQQTGQLLTYVAQEVPPEQFIEVTTTFFAEGGKGLNCTVPLKELAWAYAEHKTERAQLSKAVNTLVLQANGSILGDNTDGYGLVTDLTFNHGVNLHHANILILGAGGASRGIIAPLLAQNPAAMLIANRTPEKAVQLAREFNRPNQLSGCGFADLAQQHFDIIINATSASLSGQLPPLPANVLVDQGICYDLAYANQATPFVNWGFANGALKSLDGLGMLVEQAAEAFYIWRHQRPNSQAVIALLNAERNLCGVGK